MDKSLLSAVTEELKKAERESAKAKLKALFTDRIKAKGVVVNIDEQIVALLTSVGEDEAGVRALLKE
jgi:hypothetical protein